MNPQHLSCTATVSDAALGTVTRLFNATLTDIFNELLQNARRAGATRIDITCVDNESLGSAVVIRDNGCGVDEPKTLFVLGGSDWDEATAEREDPAGMGTFSLAKRGAIIRSRTRDSDRGWFIHVRSEHFIGAERLDAYWTDIEPGTEVMVPYDPVIENPVNTLSEVACHCPVPVFFDGKRIEQTDFLASADHVEIWHGIRIGVVPYRYTMFEKSINFHGLLVPQRPVARISFVHQTIALYDAYLDVIDCPDLQLVLPARKEVVQSDFFEHLKSTAKTVLYRFIATLDDHHLAFRDYREAQRLGVDLPEAAAMLRPYEPLTADVDQFYNSPSLVPDAAMLVAFDGGASEHQCFARAMAKADSKVTLFEPCPGYEGYAWYDALPRIIGFRNFITVNDVEIEVLPDDTEMTGVRPTRAWIDVTICRGTGITDTLSVDTDLLLVGGDAWSCNVGKIVPLVTKGSTLTPENLTAIFEAAYFWPSDDSDAGSHETQRDRFEKDARYHAIRWLICEQEAKRDAVRSAVKNHIIRLLPINTRTTITIEGREVTVEDLAD